MNNAKKGILLVAACLIVIVYANSLRVPLYLDDSLGLDFMNSLRLDGLSFQGLYDVALKGPVKNSPLANLTLALNAYFSKSPSPTGFHLVNIFFHLAAFLAVFLFLKELLWLTSVPENLRKKGFGLAIAASALWAVHPIQTQAVTFITQRATSLSALFYFLTLLFYLKGRVRRKSLYYLAGGLSFALALGSKEIAVSLPLAVFLLEWVFFATEKKKLPALFGAAVLPRLLKRDQAGWAVLRRTKAAILPTESKLSGVISSSAASTPNVSSTNMINSITFIESMMPFSRNDASSG